MAFELQPASAPSSRFEVEYDSSDGVWRVRDNDEPNAYVAFATTLERAERVRDALAFFERVHDVSKG